MWHKKLPAFTVSISMMYSKHLKLSFDYSTQIYARFALVFANYSAYEESNSCTRSLPSLISPLLLGFMIDQLNGKINTQRLQ